MTEIDFNFTGHYNTVQVFVFEASVYILQMSTAGTYLASVK